MKAMSCELCGSNDIVKQEGYFVCQHCGTKYSVEEARKLMVEGTVKVDNTDRLANLWQVARRARDNNDSEGAAKYYDLIQIEDPTSWEASFYKTYFTAMNCRIGEIRSAAISVSNCLDTVMGLIRDHVTDKAEQRAAVREISGRCITIATGLAQAAMSHYNGIDIEIEKKYREETADRLLAANRILFTCGDAIESTFAAEPETVKLAADTWRAGIRMAQSLEGEKWVPILSRNAATGNVAEYTRKLQKYDQSGYAAVRIPQLKATIAQQEKILAKTPEKATFSKLALGIGGVMVLLSVIPFFVGMGFNEWFSNTEFLILGILGLVVLYFGRPTKAKEQRNIATREGAQKALESARKELAELEK